MRMPDADDDILDGHDHETESYFQNEKRMNMKSSLSLPLGLDAAHHHQLEYVHDADQVDEVREHLL